METSSIVVTSPKSGLLRSTGFGMFLLGAALALGFVVGTREVSRALVDMRKDPNVRVKGTAQRDVRAALGSWRGSITVRGPTLEEAYVALTAASERSREFVLEQGFAAGEIRLSAVTSNATHVRDTRGIETTEVELWRMTRSIRVDSANVLGIEALSLAATDLVGEGLEIESSAPSYVLSDIDSLKKGLLEEATRNGYERARILASGGGGAVGPLASVSQGVFQIVPRASVEVSDQGEYDTSSIDKTIKAVVTLEYEMAR